MRRIAALLALAALAGCGSGGPNPIVQEAWDEAQGFWTNEPADTTGGAPPRALTRTDIETADVAAIWARLESDPRPTLLYASAQNGAHVTYFSAFRQSWLAFLLYSDLTFSWRDMRADYLHLGNDF